MKRQNVKPNEENDYSDGFYARLYGVLTSFGLNETRLIWTRYAGFLVLQGFIVHSFANENLLQSTQLVLSVIGIILSVIWHILNHSGWLNQNIWYSLSAQIDFTELKIKLPTDWWIRSRALKPTGKIYFIAQIVPIAFLILFNIRLFLILNDFGLRIDYSAIITITLLIVAWLVFHIIERGEYQDRKNVEDERPFS